ncbi:RHS repeat protein, partial [candidate division WOR-3 bacterium]|nr:RHS repeat protein [candidate division WOR-3 bacterium]
LIRTPIEDGNAYTRYQYQGNEVIIITPESDTVKKIYDAFGKNTAIIEYGNEDSLVTGFEYDDIGQLKEITDPEGKEIQYAYNNWGRIISENSPDKGAIEMQYNDITGLPIFSRKSTDRENGTAKSFKYDSLGRLILTREIPYPTWATDSLFDECHAGHLWGCYPPGCFIITRDSSSSGYFFSIEHPDSTESSTIWRDFSPQNWKNIIKLRFKYRLFPNGDTTGQFVVIVTNSQDTIQYSFISDCNSNWVWGELSFDYPPNPDFDFSCVNGLMFKYFGVNSGGGGDLPNLQIDEILLTKESRYIPKNTLYYDSYDNFNISVPDSINNPKGRLVRVNDETGWQMFFYDNRGRTAGKWQWLKWLNDTLKVYYQYNSADKLISMTYPDGSKINYNYTNSGLLEEIETGSGQSLVARYHDVYGLDSCLIYGNGVERIFQRTPRALIKEDEIYDGSASLVYDRSLNYRSDGRLSSVYSDDTLSASYQYDHYGRLTGENYQDGSYNYSYLYDKIGNRLKSNDDTLSYYTRIVGDDTLKTNRLKTAYADSFAYNGDGAAVLVGGDVYEYNWKNRVEHIDVNDSYIDHDFFYDYDFQGLRVRKEEKEVRQVFFHGKIIFEVSYKYTYYLYDASGRLLCEYDDEGNLTKKFVYLPSAIIQISSNDTSYLHLDNLG